MFAAEAARLAAIEVLTPLAAIEAGEGFPTLAGKRVYDSRAAAIGDLDEKLSYTPVLSFYSGQSRQVARADAAAGDDAECEAVLDIVAELAVAQQDDAGSFADAMAAGDPEARLVLAALVAQVIFLLTESEAGYLFRRFVLGVRRIEEEPFAVPNLGLRWQRTTIRMTIGVPQDRFDSVGGGLPEPVNTLAALLPQGSYARTKLEALAQAFAGTPRTPLAGTAIFDDPAADPETDAPIASTGDID